ncbi:MAG TPA: PA14 domain-containing protein [Kofleriaceae bacterium]
MRAAAFLVVTAMLGGCGFKVGSSTSGDDAGGDDATETPHPIVDDTADEFNEHLSSLADGVIASRGAIEPAGFVTDGLHARAYTTTGLVTATATWDGIVAALANQVGEAWSVVPKDWSHDRPFGLGLTSSDNFTLIFDGEVKLPAGNVDVGMDIDDHALLQISLDGGATWSSQYDGTDSPNTTKTLSVPAAGWYPMRLAYEEGGVSARAAITLAAGGGAAVLLDATMLRARVSDAHGLLLHAWNSVGFGTDVATESSLPAADIDFMQTPPKVDLGLGMDNFTLRLTGQILITQDATYAFSVSTDMEAWRVLVDGQLVGNTWLPQITTPVQNIALKPGWHDILIDYIEGTGPANLHLRVVGGDLNGPVAADRFRPVAAQGRFAVLTDATTHNLVDATGANAPGIAEVPFTTTGIAGATIEMTDWLYDIDGRNAQEAAQITAQLACLPSQKAGSIATPTDAVNQIVVAVSDTSCAGEPYNGMWKLIFTDNVMGGAVGTVKDLVVATYHGGDVRQPFARTTQYISNPIATPNAVGYGHAAFTADARGATIELAVRTGDDEAALDAASWVPVASDATPAVEPHELIQYRVTIAQDGWQNASVDRVSLIYTTR